MCSVVSVCAPNVGAVCVRGRARGCASLDIHVCVCACVYMCVCMCVCVCVWCVLCVCVCVVCVCVICVCVCVCVVCVCACVCVHVRLEVVVGLQGSPFNSVIQPAAHKHKHTQKTRNTTHHTRTHTAVTHNIPHTNTHITHTNAHTHIAHTQAHNTTRTHTTHTPTKQHGGVLPVSLRMRIHSGRATNTLLKASLVTMGVTRRRVRLCDLYIFHSFPRTFCTSGDLTHFFTPFSECVAGQKSPLFCPGPKIRN